MTVVAFNANWNVRPKTSIFAALQGAGASATSVTLPHDALFSTERVPTSAEGAATGYFEGGAFEYSKTFDIPEGYRTKRVTLELQGVYRDAMVYINGQFAAQHPFGYSTFYIELDPFLIYGGPNTVRVDARAHQDSRWYTGIGIHREARLHVTELVHVIPNGIRVTTPDVDGERALVHVASSVQNADTGTRTVIVATELRDQTDSVIGHASSPITLRSGETGVVRHQITLRDANRWSLDDPYLYTARTVLRDGPEDLETLFTRFGVRVLQLDPEHGLRINGEPVLLRGACVHHDNGILGAAAIARAEERRVEILKRAGFNAIRSAHNPISQQMLDACDRLGMLVMDETFDMWAESKSAFDYSLSFPEWWERDVEAMVGKDFNHPSVIFYSIGNEIPETGSPMGGVWSRRLAEKVRSLDSTRYVTNGINGFVAVLTDVLAGMQAQGGATTDQGVNGLMGNAGDFMNRISASPLVSQKTEESFSVLDVAGINYGDGRYEMDRDLFPQRIIVGTETFPTHIDTNWKLVQELPNVIGDFTWTGWDYLGEAGIGRVMYTDESDSPSLGAPFPWLAAWCGDIDITGHRRPVSYYRETVFGLRQTPYIAVQRPENYGRSTTMGQWAWTDSIASWSSAVAIGAPIVVEVYSNADEVELLLNGEPVGRQTVGAERAFQATFVTTYAPGELTAVAFDVGVESGRSSLSSADDSLIVRAVADRSSIHADASDLCFVDIELQDSRGNLASHRDRRMIVSVTGSGELAALGSARPDPTERYDSTEHTTFDGRLLAVIRPRAAGTIEVTITTEGADPVVVTITALEGTDDGGH